MSANETAVIADAMADFFAPTSTDMVQGLVAEYRRDRQRIADAVKFAESDAFKGVWHYFAKGNADENRGHSSLTNSVEQAFREAGYHIPDDISFIGYDDVPASSISQPPLTTNRVNKMDSGRLAVERLIRRIEQPAEGFTTTQVASEFIVRQSVKNLKKRG